MNNFHKKNFDFFHPNFSTTEFLNNRANGTDIDNLRVVFTLSML